KCSFFLQAEDGIRAFHVTGVQTCALPISPAPVAAAVPTAPTTVPAPAPMAPTPLPMPAPVAALAPPSPPPVQSAALPSPAARNRSEERRVGKERRCPKASTDGVPHTRAKQ